MPAMPEPITATSQLASPSSAPAARITSTSIQSDLLAMMGRQSFDAGEVPTWCVTLRGGVWERGVPGGVAFERGNAMSDNLTNRVQPDRSKINMNEDYEVKYWTHALGVTREALQKAVDKVGNSAATVRKELG